MTHRQDVERYAGTLADLAADCGNLRYDALAFFLHQLARKLATDAAADAGRGRPQLAAELQAASASIGGAADAVDRAWRICAPHM